MNDAIITWERLKMGLTQSHLVTDIVEQFLPNVKLQDGDDLHLERTGEDTIEITHIETGWTIGFKKGYLN